MNFFEAYGRYLGREKAVRKLLRLLYLSGIKCTDNISSKDVNYFVDRMKYYGE